MGFFDGMVRCGPAVYFVVTGEWMVVPWPAEQAALINGCPWPLDRRGTIPRSDAPAPALGAM